MSLYFEVKATYDKMTENGSIAKVTEPYLFDALCELETASIKVRKALISM